MRGIIITIVVAGLIAVLVLDGVGMYSAHTRAVGAAQAAAQQAVTEYASAPGSDVEARQAADQIASDSGAKLVSVVFHSADTQWVEVTVSATPRVYLLRYIPYVRAHLAQESTAVVHF
jgi:hypothetical protein